VERKRKDNVKVKSDDERKKEEGNYICRKFQNYIHVGV
jgi:hypothetical protein